MCERTDKKLVHSKHNGTVTLKTLLSLMFGIAIAFVATILMVTAIFLVLLGVGGGVLVRARPSTTQVINYDPSKVATYAPIAATASIFLFIIYGVIFRKLEPRRSHSRRR